MADSVSSTIELNLSLNKLLGETKTRKLHKELKINFVNSGNSQTLNPGGILKQRLKQGLKVFLHTKNSLIYNFHFPNLNSILMPKKKKTGLLKLKKNMKVCAVCAA
ncbi:hypothetical protein ACROYT_G024380 [Oculina patagonica]